MISAENESIAERAQQLYAARLQAELEGTQMNKFVAIEPESGDYFIDESFSGAVAAARLAHPSRISFVIRVGRKAALHIGGVAG